MRKPSQTSRGRVLVEICAGDVMSAVAAEAGGADRVELCDNLASGGTTPSAGAIALACRQVSIPVHVLVRPRGGDFVYAPLEIAVMCHDIEVAKALGAAGVVVGVLTADGTIDREQMAILTELARPLSLTFHKAFDQARDQKTALGILMELGIDRVLTSGGQATALEGVETLARLGEIARGRLAVMAGGRLDALSLPRVIRQAKVNEVHVGSAVSEMNPGGTAFTALEGFQTSWLKVNAQRVAQIVSVVRASEDADQSMSG
jgi:copper homeostasis protein